MLLFPPQAINCSLPETHPHQEMSGTSLTYTSFWTVTCLPGYQFVDGNTSKVIQCNGTGHWDNWEPCQRKLFSGTGGRQW